MCSYLQKSPANSLSRAGNDVRTRRCTFELYPQTTQNTRKKICVFLRVLRAKNLSITSKGGQSPNDKAQRPGSPDAEQTRDSWPNRNAKAGFAGPPCSAKLLVNLVIADARRLYLSPRRGKKKIAQGKGAQRLPPWVTEPPTSTPLFMVCPADPAGRQGRP